MKMQDVNLFKKEKLFYDWGDQEYREFMSEVLKSLEPCHYGNNNMLVEEQDEFGEITFINQGTIGIDF